MFQYRLMEEYNVLFSLVFVSLSIFLRNTCVHLFLLFFYPNVSLKALSLLYILKICV
jgi:hypothetical protein